MISLFLKPSVLNIGIDKSIYFYLFLSIEILLTFIFALKIMY